VVTCESRWSRSLASPKSPTIASQKSSSNMFAAFTSLWMILGSHCSCRYSRPLAAPSAIPFLVIQFSGGFPVIVYVRTKLIFGQMGFIKTYPEENKYKCENQMQIFLY
jgi:hypothetical protein